MNVASIKLHCINLLYFFSPHFFLSISHSRKWEAWSLPSFCHWGCSKHIYRMVSLFFTPPATQSSFTADSPLLPSWPLSYRVISRLSYLFWKGAREAFEACRLGTSPLRKSSSCTYSLSHRPCFHFIPPHATSSVFAKSQDQILFVFWPFCVLWALPDSHLCFCLCLNGRVLLIL